MKRRQFLKSTVAVAVAAVAPRVIADDRFEIEKWFEREQPNTVSFTVQGFEKGDIVTMSWWDKQNPDREWMQHVETKIITSVDGSAMTVEDYEQTKLFENGRRVQHRSRNPYPVSRRLHVKNERHYDHLRGRRGLGSNHRRWQSHHA